ncbi:FeoB-associated Cys-rich membrane protein [Sporomusa sp. KB1]|jgi:hypothetical protein|uniref:FeoB-associated Cys-rich membrane protein n=1 Tax=Sporomusa sp. KB1 TaxID=943346 RepID=UPI0011A601FF|nr:FeoB-associated Cys-rich membrane protein [Sporomusa sp. KB1]TWH46678.1 hypothetical protein Salpa_2683 [Sporomusa sp. KB1]
METLLVSLIGIAAIGYAGYMVWQSISGKHGCSCGNGGSCQTSGGSCCSTKKVLRKLP